MKFVRSKLVCPGTANVTMRADPSLHLVVFGMAIGFDDDRATGVVLRDPGHQLRVARQ